MPPRKPATSRGGVAAGLAAWRRASCALRTSSHTERSQSRSLGIQCTNGSSGDSSLPVEAKTGCAPLRHQSPALGATSLTQSTSSRSGTPCRAASSSSRSAFVMRSRVKWPFQSPASTRAEHEETLMPAYQCHSSWFGFQPSV